MSAAKPCSQCQQPHPADAFPKRGQVCKACRARNQRNRRHLLPNSGEKPFTTTRKCCRCGETKEHNRNDSGCRECRRQKERARYAGDPELRLRKALEYAAKA